MPFETDTKRAQDEARKRGWSERVYFEVQVYDVDNCSVNEYFCPASLVSDVVNNMVPFIDLFKKDPAKMKWLDEILKTTPLFKSRKCLSCGKETPNWKEHGEINQKPVEYWKHLDQIRIEARASTFAIEKLESRGEHGKMFREISEEAKRLMKVIEKLEMSSGEAAQGLPTPSNGIGARQAA